MLQPTMYVIQLWLASGSPSLTNCPNCGLHVPRPRWSCRAQTVHETAFSSRTWPLPGFLVSLGLLIQEAVQRACYPHPTSSVIPSCFLSVYNKQNQVMLETRCVSPHPRPSSVTEGPQPHHHLLANMTHYY